MLIPYLFDIHFNIIQRMGLPGGVLPLTFPTIILYAFLVLRMRDT